MLVNIGGGGNDSSVINRLLVYLNQIPNIIFIVDANQLVIHDDRPLTLQWRCNALKKPSLTQS